MTWDYFVPFSIAALHFWDSVPLPPGAEENRMLLAGLP